MYDINPKTLYNIRSKFWYRATNGAWNRSGVNHPKNIGYLMEHIGRLKPDVYKDWERYFFNNIADPDKLLELTYTFRTFVLEDKEIGERFDYTKLDIGAYYQMTACRLIYETWLGYLAERETGKIVVRLLDESGCPVVAEGLSPENDNKYAVDFLLYHGGKLVCGLQVKSENYLKSKQGIVSQTIDHNHQKNERFTSVYGVPVKYAFYRRVGEQHFLVNEDVIVEIKSLCSL